LVRTLVHLETLPPGFDPHNVVTATASLDEACYHSQSNFLSLLNESIAAMKRIPGVENAAVGLSVPYERSLNLAVEEVSTTYVTPNYFAALRMPILAGRGVRDADTAKSEPVAVVNEAFAKKFFGTPNVVGRHFSMAMGRTKSAPPMTIVGVVGNVTKEPGIHRNAPLGTEPVFYVPAA